MGVLLLLFGMARKPRIHYPGACYHVILRGNAGQDIFFDEKDRNRFFFLIQEGIERFKHRIHAYCLMTNHVHMAVQVADVPLSRIIQNVSFRYTRYINHYRNRRGHLFQGRYQAILIDADSYLLELVRYIHNNPVRAGMVQTPDEYNWSSHNAYLERMSAPWLTTGWVMSQFATQKKEAIERYKDFVLKSEDREHRKEFHHGSVDGRILGEDCFAEEALSRVSQEGSHEATLEQVIQAVCAHYEISKDNLSSGSRQRRTSEPRSVVALLVRDSNHLSLTDLSRRFKRDLSGVSQSASRLEKRLVTDKTFLEKLNNIKKMIN